MLHAERTFLGKPLPPRLESQGWGVLTLYQELPSHKLEAVDYEEGVPNPMLWLEVIPSNIPSEGSKARHPPGGEEGGGGPFLA